MLVLLKHDANFHVLTDKKSRTQNYPKHSVFLMLGVMTFVLRGWGPQSRRDNVYISPDGLLVTRGNYAPTEHAFLMREFSE